MASHFPRLLALAPPLIYGADRLLRRRPKPHLIVEALLDECAHALTDLLLLDLVKPRAALEVVAASLAGAVLLDLDHIPQYLGWNVIAPIPGERPHTHSLAVPFALAALALFMSGHRRTVTAAVAFGAATHLLRDAATGGAALFWPRTRRLVRAPYHTYAALVAVTAAISGRRPR